MNNVRTIETRMVVLLCDDDDGDDDGVVRVDIDDEDTLRLYRIE